MTDISWPSTGASALPRPPGRSLERVEALLAVAGIGAWSHDVLKNRMWWSEETRRILGVGPDVVPSRDAARSFHAAEAQPVITAAMDAAISHGTSWDLELALVRANGERIWVRSRGRANPDGPNPRTIIGTLEDVTARRRRALDHERLALIVKQMTNAALITDAQGRTTWLNDSFVKLTGFGMSELHMQKPGALLQGPDTDPADAAAIAAALKAGAPICRDILNYHRSGSRYWVELRVDPIRDARGVLTGFVAITSDVTARREAADSARREIKLRTETETLLRDVLEAIPAALSVYDKRERLMLVNHSYKHILPAANIGNKGERLEDIVRRKVGTNHYAPEILAADPPAVREAWIADYLARHRSENYSRVFLLSNGRWVQARNALSPSGNTVSIRTDITRLKQAEAELRHIAEHDSLTGLVNRPVLLQRMEAHLACRRSDAPKQGTLVMFDIDFFKSVNDGLGHAAGDTLLRLVARRLQRMIRSGDTIARLGGDEFALILPGLWAEAPLRRFLDRLLARQRRPVRLGNNRYIPSISVGVTRWPADGDDAETLLSNADAALYEAKAQGRSRYAFFDAALAARMERRTRLADRLRTAIPAGDIAVALQPQLRLAENGSATIKGFEALARWHHGDEWVPPSEFVAIAEDVGLAQALGAAVMDKALASHAMLIRRDLGPGQIAVNISTAQLLSDDFLESLRQMLCHHRIGPELLEIEITETVLLDRSVARIGETLETLRRHGVSLSLDDFGTGYASLSHLTAFPVDRIKIDASFTAAIGKPGDAGLIARTIITLGRGLGLEVVAEGVETEAQLAFLAGNGCDAVQGYLIAAPMLPDAAGLWLENWAKNPRAFNIPPH